MNEFAYVAPIGGIALVAFLALHRLGGNAAPLWAWAWVALYGAGLVASIEEPPAWVAAVGTYVGSQFPVLLLAGALQSAGRRPSRWLIPGGVAFGLVRAATLAFFGAPVSFALALAVEPALILAGALALWRPARAADATLADRVLPAAFLAVAAVGAVDSLARMTGAPTGPMLPAWIGTSLLLVGLQAITLIERTRTRERRLLHEHDRLARLIERTSDAVALCDPQGQLVYLNEAGRALFAIPPDLPIERVNLREMQPESRTEAEDEALRVALARDGIAQRDRTIRRFDGTRLDVSEVVLLEKDPAGRTSGFGVLIRDETARAAAEHEAHQRARDLDLLRRIAEAGLTGESLATVVERMLGDVRRMLGIDAASVYLLGADGVTLEIVGTTGIAPGSAAQMATVSAALPIPRTVLDASQPVFIEALADNPLVENEAVRNLAMGVAAGAALRAHDRVLGLAFFGRRERRRWTEAERKLIGVVAGQIALAVDHARGIEERGLQAAQLAAERRTLRAVLETAPVGITVYDENERVAVMNRTSAQHFGLGDPERWIGAPGADVSAAVLPRVRSGRPDVAAPHEGEPGHELQLVLVETPGRGLRQLQVLSGPVRTGGGERAGRIRVSRDVTEERRLEEELRQSQKMETVGRFAGGIAHDFNNQLTVVLGNAKLLEDALPAESHPQAALEDLVRAAEHCAKLTHGLLSFARRSPVSPRPVAPAQALREMESTLRAVLPSSIQLEVAAEAELPPVQADPTQLQQVLFNLALNARDAIRGGGRIVLRAHRGAGKVRRPGAWVCFEVEDTGVGIEPEVQGRIFEPFFTTKAVGEGTGLGLSVVYGVVESHGGFVEVDSEPGRGSLFRVGLPLASEAARAAESARALASLPGGSETLLLADDEPTVLRLARTWLERLGYEVIAAKNGDEAVALHAEHAGRIDLAVLDVTMPGRGGDEALAAMRAREPGLPAILASGNFDPSDASPGAGDADVLAKPYSRDKLAHLVRAVLDRRARAAG